MTVRACLAMVLALALGNAGAIDTVPLARVAEAPALAGLALPDLDGTRHPLLASRERAITVLHLWATWCGPCRKELPALDRLPARLGECDVRVIAIAEDRAEDVREFIADYPLAMTVLIDRYGEALHALRTRGFPETHVVDPAGQLRLQATGAVDWDSPDTLQAMASLCPAAGAI